MEKFWFRDKKGKIGSCDILDKELNDNSDVSILYWHINGGCIPASDKVGDVVVSDSGNIVQYGNNSLPTIQFRESDVVYNCFHSINTAKYIKATSPNGDRILKYFTKDGNSLRIGSGVYENRDVLDLIYYLYDENIEKGPSVNKSCKVTMSSDLTMSLVGWSILKRFCTKGPNLLELKSSTKISTSTEEGIDSDSHSDEYGGYGWTMDRITETTTYNVMFAGFTVYTKQTIRTRTHKHGGYGSISGSGGTIDNYSEWSSPTTTSSVYSLSIS